MQRHTFAELVTGIATLLRIAPPAPGADSLQLVVDEMPVSLFDNGAVQAGSMLFVCDFGPIPFGAARAGILQDLLQSNLYTVSTAAPTFCLNTDASHALFVGRLALGQTSVNRMLQALTAFAAEARTWRHNCQDSASTPSRGMPARQHRLLHLVHSATIPQEPS